MYNKPAKCMTPNCPNMSYHIHCLSCSAQEASARALQAAAGLCTHRHSIVGEYEVIKRFLPEYMGGRSQPGYMLDVCKSCLQELQERPYNPTRPGRRH
jgi:hypothetical protein